MSHSRFAAIAVLAGIPLWACASSPADTGLAAPPPIENFSAYATTPAGLRADLRASLTREAQWTRLYATSAIAGLGDTGASLARLMQSEDAIAATIAPLYGQTTADELTGLLHARVAAITSLVASHQTTSERSLGTRDALDGSAQAIARFWARVAPTLWVRDLTSRLVAQNDALVDALQARESRDYARSVLDFERAESSALAFADMVSRAIVQKLPETFTPSTVQPRQETLQLALRSINDERVFWTRAYLAGSMAGDPVQPELDRAVQATVDMGRAYAAYYGPDAGIVIQVHAHAQLTDALAYYFALTKYDSITVDRIANEWDVHLASYANDLATYDGAIDRSLVLRRLEVVAFQERSMIRARVEQRWTDDIASYDALLDNTDAFADVLAYAVSLQFPQIL